MESATISTNPFAKANAAPAAEIEAAPEAPPGVDFDNLGTPFGTPESEDEFSFDLSNAQSQAVITPGRYIATLSDLVKGTSQSGNPMWTFTFTIHRMGDGSETPFAGRTLKKFCALTPAALGIFTNVVEALGLGEPGKPMKFTKQEALNRLVYINVAAGEYNGQPQANVQQLNPYEPIGKKYSAF